MLFATCTAYGEGDGSGERPRRAFPCWDEPEYKATFGVTLVVDADLTAVSNAAEALVAITSPDNPLPRISSVDLAHALQGDIDNAATVEFRQDRFIAAVDWQSADPFRLAYIVRAISPGSYHLPAATVEDMYRPDYRAWTDAGSVTVAE